jgi:glycosyltransferase involved in cell wall biosynthesis
MSGRTIDRRSPAVGAPMVSIVLPTYNRAELVGRAIRSVLNQTYKDFELLVVDDGSTDATKAEVARIHDPRLRYLGLEQNRGAAAARNVGIRHTTGRFLAFQDSDDEWVSVKLELQMRSFEAAMPEIGVVYSDKHRILRDGTTLYHRSPTVVSGVLIDPRTRFYQVCKVGIQASVIRRDCLAHVGEFNEAFPALEDLELFIRLSQRYRFHHVTTPLVKYYETDGLSKNEPAKRVARALLLRLYRTALEREDSTFVAREVAALRRAEGHGRTVPFGSADGAGRD